MSSSENLKIPLEVISLATNNFSEANIIGRGGFGTVYKGQSRKHGLLALKRLNLVYGQGHHEYGMEVTLLSKYEHENLVSLIGFCDEDGEKILVYKYEANGSLDKVLGSNDLSWMQRLQICVGVARGLRYLHNEIGSEHRVIHRDIKSSNILLGENWNAKISDFGLSKIDITNSPNSVIFTSPCGTHGYVDPQILNGGITPKSDVYSFGVVLYEVLFRKLVATPEYIGNNRFTVRMAKEHYEKNTLDMMIDPELRNQMNSDSLSTFSAIAYECLNDLREDRPTMSLVVEELEKAFDYQQGSSIESFGLSSSELLYDVYISFRSDDGFSRCFTCNLILALESEGLSPYRDIIFNACNRSLLLPAIKQSRAFIIVFSKIYTIDYWNLEEVAEIVKCAKKRGNVVIPIFGDVDPYQVKEHIRHLDEALFNCDRPQKIGVWKNATVEAADVPGLEAKNFQSCEDLAKEAAAAIKGKITQASTYVC